MFKTAILLLFLVSGKLALEKSYCTLKWVPQSADDAFPKESVGSDGTKFFVARALTSSIFVGLVSTFGYADGSNGKGYFADRSSLFSKSSYEVLQNPNDCILAWVPHGHPDATKFRVASSTGYVGRAQRDDNSFAAGEVEISSKTLYVFENGTSKAYGPDKNFVLTAIAGGLRMRIVNFEITQDFGTASYEMFGFNVIHNNADTLISQTVTHTKSVTESVILETDTSWGGAMYAGAEICIPFLCVGGGIEIQQVNSQSSALTTLTEKTVTVSRTVTVPLDTSIQACSLMARQENFTSSWTGRAEFTCPGLNAGEVAELVRKDADWSDKNFNVFANVASAEISGKFIGDLKVGTKFFVSDPNDGAGCSAIQRVMKQHGRISEAQIRALGEKRMLTEVKT